MMRRRVMSQALLIRLYAVLTLDNLWHNIHTNNSTVLYAEEYNGTKRFTFTKYMADDKEDFFKKQK